MRRLRESAPKLLAAGDGMGSEIYSRKFLRIRAGKPLCGSARIVRLGDKPVRTGTALVDIPEISPGGLKFISHLRIPADPSVILQISLVLNGTAHRMEGYIVHGRKNAGYGYEYGFCFLNQDKGLRDSLIKLFSERIHKMDRCIIVDPAFPYQDP